MEKNIPQKIPIFQMIPELETLTIEEAHIVRSIIKYGFYQIWDYGCDAMGFKTEKEKAILEKMAKIPLFFGEDE
jgi:hypothetical protein